MRSDLSVPLILCHANVKSKLQICLFHYGIHNVDFQKGGAVYEYSNIHSQ